MGVRYIGSKVRVARQILDIAGAPDGGRFVDAFSGAGSIAATAAERGWPVTVNDSLPSSVAMSIGACVGVGNVSFKRLGGYAAAVAKLNSLPGVEGFIHAEYSPASALTGPVERKYFTEANAARIDAMREMIETWSVKGLVTGVERELLLADLIHAANSVANISGTYGCFLKDWTPTSLREIRVIERELPHRTTDLKAVVGDVKAVPHTESDTVYLDPPYTKRQYGAYYHLLETIHAGDCPAISGKTGLRPWRDKASDFCYKSRALGAIIDLVNTLAANRILLSYSNEGHVPMDLLVAGLEPVGDVTIHEVKAIGRYRPNSRASAAGASVQEFLLDIQMSQGSQGVVSW